MPRLCVICSFVSIITVLVGISVGSAQAATVPELTGNFALSGQGGAVSAGGFGSLTPSGAFFTYSPPANFPPGQTTVITCDPEPTCDMEFVSVTLFSGSATGGGVNMGAERGGQSISMTGVMTGGTISGYSEFDFSSPSSFFTFDKSTFDFTFRGVWSNGWVSEGSSQIFGQDDEPCCIGPIASGSVAMTTFTPEPSTFMLLGAGLLPVIGVIRRRYLNR